MYERYSRWMRAFVFLGGSGPRSVDRLDITDSDVIIAADSGLDLARSFGLRPHYIVGDFDSISDLRTLDEHTDAVVERFSSEKDFTDAELGLKKAREIGAQEIHLIGGGGGRLDHLLGLVALFEQPSPPYRWITGESEVFLVRGEWAIHGRVGELISFFPLGSEECRMSSAGLKWPLDKLVWRRGDAGISNEFSSEEASITMRSGSLLSILPERRW